VTNRISEAQMNQVVCLVQCEADIDLGAMGWGSAKRI